MKRLKDNQSLRESLASREANDSFTSTTAIAHTMGSPASWHYALFRKCRTFDEVKTLAKANDLEATNELGCIQLTRKGQLIGSLWLFD